MLSRVTGSVAIRRSASAKSVMSCPGTSRPVFPSLTAVVSPPTAAATTGVPQACASRATRPKDSEYDGTQTTEAARYHSASPAPAIGLTNRVTSSTSRARASSACASGCSIPLPDGPPMIATTSRSRSDGSCSSIRAAALIRMSGAFKGWIRPTKASRTASSGTPTARRAAACEPGLKTSRSTPGLTTPTLAGCAPYRVMSSRASSSVFASNRSAASTTCSSPINLAGGSGTSSSARLAFFTFAIVCIVCTRGTAHRSRASRPTWPDNQ